MYYVYTLLHDYTLQYIFCIIYLFFYIIIIIIMYVWRKDFSY